MAKIGRTARFTATTKVKTKNSDFSSAATKIDAAVLRPKMIQAAPGDLEFEFPFGLNNFSHDVGAVQFDELARPLQLPLLQTTAGTLHKVSFDFIVARRGDGMGETIDDELATLQNFAAEDSSVIFVNVHQMMATSVISWKIQSMSVQVTRVNETGEAVSAQVNMSCSESSDGLERFLTLPKFTYKNPRGTGKGGTDSPPDGNAHATIQNFWAKLTPEMRANLKPEYRQQWINALNQLAKNYGGDSRVNNILMNFKGNYGTPTELFNLLEREVKAKGLQTTSKIGS